MAAINDAYADSSVGNVTGSNAVNVFLGIGIAWLIASVKHAVDGKNEPFRVEAGSLAFSVTIFCVFGFIAITIMLIRRIPSIGEELGGPPPYKKLTSGFFILLWVLYVLLSSLENYCYIEGF